MPSASCWDSLVTCVWIASRSFITTCISCSSWPISWLSSLISLSSGLTPARVIVVLTMLSAPLTLLIALKRPL